MEYLKWVHEELGVKAITIANPLYVSKVSGKFPNIEISASVLGDIDCVQRAVIFRKVGADIISPDVNINRDLGLLKDIKEATGAELKLLVNEGCLYKCPFRKFHFNATSHASREPGRFIGKVIFADFFGFGFQVIREDPSQLLKSCWIRPEDLRGYSEITSYFKIVGRAQLKSFVIRAAKAYLEEKWNGDLLDIISGCSKRFSLKVGAYLNNESLGEHKFFETVTSCNNRCGQCSFCKDLAEQLIEIGVITPEKGEDTDPNNMAERLRNMGRLP
jgi:collagenase-like PrtC family protease